MGHAKRNAYNPFTKKNYADLASCIDAAKGPMKENGLSIVQTIEQGEDGKQYVRTTLMHTSGEFMESMYLISSERKDPQSVGSAITYARRYSYAALIGIANVDEEDDANEATIGADSGLPYLTPEHEKWNKAVDYFKQHGNLDGVLKKFQIAPEHLQLITGKK